MFEDDKDKDKNREEEERELDTELLKRRYAEDDDLDKFLRENINYFNEDKLYVVLINILDKAGYRIKDVINNTYIDSSYIYQIFRGDREPSRNKLIQILIFFKLPVFEVNRILKIAGRSPLYIKNIRDVIIMHGIEKEMSLDQIEELLIDRDMESLQ